MNNQYVGIYIILFEKDIKNCNVNRISEIFMKFIILILNIYLKLNLLVFIY